MEYERSLRATAGYGGEEGLRAAEQAFLDDHDGDKELEQARWVLLQLSKEHGIPVAAVRNALLNTHIRLEARRRKRRFMMWSGTRLSLPFRNG